MKRIFFTLSVLFASTDRWIGVVQSFHVITTPIIACRKIPCSSTKEKEISSNEYFHYEEDTSFFSTTNNENSFSSSSWSVADDWSALSRTGTATDNTIDTTTRTDAAAAAAVMIDAPYNYDASEVAMKMTEYEPNNVVSVPLSEEDIWIRDVVDEIHNAYSTLDDTTKTSPLITSSIDQPSPTSSTSSLDEAIQNAMDDEIAMLIRCNEQPESMLIAEGRALPPLTQAEKDDVSQLIIILTTMTNNENGVSFQATDFLCQAVSKMFHQHATPSPIDGILSLDRNGIASWMTTSLQNEQNKGKISPNDHRVLTTISQYSHYGSGRLVEQDLQTLYFSTIVGDTSNLSLVSAQRHLTLRKPFIDSVWRDIRAHGILSPAEEQLQTLVEEMRLQQTLRKMNHHDASNTAGTTTSTSRNDENLIVDECEILEWNGGSLPVTVTQEKQTSSTKRRSTKGLASHKLIEMAKDNETPLRMRDGEFVFIDEESCIGCAMCTNVAPSAFVMVESGRVRTFHQRSGSDIDQAVQSCPVSCMHHVSFRELKELETARDEGDGRTDHRHLGHPRGHTPLYVAGMDSDNNHRSSWYHTLKHKCLMSSDCPKRGCFDCPKYDAPGDNPYFIAKHKHAEHIRAQTFIQNGDVDEFRKTADL